MNSRRLAGRWHGSRVPLVFLVILSGLVAVLAVLFVLAGPVPTLARGSDELTAGVSLKPLPNPPPLRERRQGQVARLHPTQAAGPQGESNSAWRTERVVTPRMFGEMTDHSLAIDGDGHVHIVGGGDHLYHVWDDGTQWQIETVEENWGVGRYAALFLSATPPYTPHISYYDATNGDLKYAHLTGDGWVVELVDSAGDVGYWTSLGIDSAGYAHISYWDSTHGEVKYARQTAGAWVTETVESTQWGDVTSLATDSAMTVHLAYQTDEGIRYARRAASGWSFETFENGEYPSLVLDNAGSPRIAYMVWDSYHTQHSMIYASRTASGWITDSFSLSGWSGDYTALALDGAGNPAITYRRGDDLGCGVMYARRAGDTWDDQVVAQWGEAGTCGSPAPLALDGNGDPHIAYVGEANDYRDLRYIHWTESEWDIQTVAGGGWSGDGTALALDAYGVPHISYTEGTFATAQVRYVRWYQNEWNVQTLDSSLCYQRTSVALDTAGHPHISYYYDNGWPDIGVAYAYWTGSQWVSQTIGRTAWGGPNDTWGAATSIALEASTAYPHIGYYNDGLWHASYDGTAWHTETVDSDWDAGMYASLALDANSRAHIGYYDDDNSDLKYAHWDGSQWIIEVVDSSGDVGQDTSLALDANGYPHISYWLNSPDGWIYDELRYARWNGSAWITETVDSNGVGAFTSLALDSDAHPHISYYDAANSDLKYAHWNGSQWVIEVVDSPGRVGTETSLALDVAGNPHIGYQDVTNGDLKYAWRATGAAIRVSGGRLYAVDGVGIEFPAGAVTGTTAIVYTPVETATPPSGFSFAGHAFDLAAYRNGALLPGLTFNSPVTVTLHYADSDVAGLDEASLVLEYWNEGTSAWEDAACGDYDRHPDGNWLAVPICHLSRFALFGEAAEKYTVYLPLTLRNY